MIAIVGGGISGLVLAYHLTRRGVPHVVLEAQDTPGGVVRTVLREGKPLDLGPQRMRLTGEIRDLVASLGLTGELLTAPPDLPLWVYRRRKLRRVPFTVGQAVSTNLVGWGGKLRVLLEPLTSGPRCDESVEAFLSRKFGKETYRALLGPLYGGLYASDPARMKVRHGLARTLEELGAEGSLLGALLRRSFHGAERDPTVTFEMGLETLPRALAEALGPTLRMSTPVDWIERRGSDWVLHLGGEARGETVSARSVALTLPAPAASRILEKEDEEAARRVGSLRYNPLAVVHLHSECDLVGMGYQVAFGETLETRGVTWNASMFGRQGVFTAYLGGMRNPRLVERDAAALGSIAAEEFTEVTGCEARVLHVSRSWMPAWDETWSALDGLRLPSGVELCTSWSARPGVPGRFADARAAADRLAK